MGPKRASTDTPMTVKSASLRRRPASSTSWRLHRAFQLAFRPSPRRRVSPADREHRHRREVAEATEQIKESLSWLGLDWDGPVTFQSTVASAARSRHAACSRRARPTRTRARSDPHAGRCVTGWDDAVRGPVEVPSEDWRSVILAPTAPDLQLRLAARRLARRHHARHPRRRSRLQHAQADPRAGALGARFPSTPRRKLLGTDGKKLRNGTARRCQIRARATARGAGQLSGAGRWSTTTTPDMSREWSSGFRSSASSPAGHLTRELELDERPFIYGSFRRRPTRAAHENFLGEQGSTGRELRHVPIVHESSRLDRYPE